MAVAKVYQTEVEFRIKLNALGLNYPVIERVALEGLYAARETTPHDAVMAAGIRRWLDMVRALRDEMCPLGWDAKRIDGHELLVSPDRIHAINIIAGDASTGNPEASPLTKSSKGAATRAAAQNNMRQARLFSISPYVVNQPTRLGDLTLWTLLHFHDRDNGVIRLELSMPIGMDEQGRVADWYERIILPSVRVDGANDGEELLIRPYDDQEEIDVEVTRRATRE